MALRIAARALTLFSLVAVAAALALLTRPGDSEARLQYTLDEPSSAPLAGSTGSAVPTAAPTSVPGPGTPVTLSLTVAQDRDSRVYTLQIRNTGAQEISGLYVAGSLPQGAALKAAWTPLGSSFDGPRDGLVSWQIPSLPPGAAMGPFRYSFTGGGDPGAAVAFAHWSGPSEGATLASPTTIAQEQTEEAETRGNDRGNGKARGKEQDEARGNDRGNGKAKGKEDRDD